MGIVSCPIVCHSEQESLSHSSFHNSDSSLISLSSQPSLPTVLSLTSKSSPNQLTSTSTNHESISTLKGHSSYVFSLTLSSKFLYSGSSDKEIRIWSRDEILNGNQTHDNSSINNIVLANGNGAIKSLAVFNNKLFSAHQDNKIRVWLIENQQNYKQLATLPTFWDRLSKSILPKNQIQIRRNQKCSWVHHVDAISELALSKDGSLLYSASWDRSFKIWRSSDFKCLESVTKAHDDAINAIVISKDGLVYTGSADRKIKVWKKVAGEKKHSLMATLEKHKSSVNALALSDDGSILYSGACDRSIIVWEKSGGGGVGGGGEEMVVVGALRGHTKAILCLGIVSDLIFSGSADKTIRVWRRDVIDNGGGYSCLAVFEGHTGPVKCLTATVDHSNSANSGQSSSSSYLVYSGSLDCDIKIWQISVPYL